jgi:hypothetical protein
MSKVDDVAWMSQRHGFMVRQDDDQTDRIIRVH